MAYTTNRFCWHGLLTNDKAKAKAFYTEVLGFKTMEAPMGADVATMFVAGGVPLAHYMTPPMAGMPDYWENYLRVDDVDASTKAAVENGGKQIHPPMDIPVGRFSAVASPSGAVLMLFHEGNEAEAQHHPGGVGSVCWVELHSQDLSADVKWLESTFGLESAEMPMPEGGNYTLLNHGDEHTGGAMQAMSPQQPSAWLTWFEVDDVDAAFARVKQHGGQTFTDVMAMEGVGRMAFVADSNGAAFGILEPAPRPKG